MAENSVESHANWQLDLLNQDHDASGFESDSDPLNRFVKEDALQFHEKGICRVYIANEPGSRRVVGYYTLSCGSVNKEFFSTTQSKSLRGHHAPVVLLGKLAVCNSSKGKVLGTDLLVHALKNVIAISKSIGVYAVEVTAKDGKKGFYERYQCSPLTDDPNHLFLSAKKLALIAL